jgi:hypothetical protein
VVRENSSSNARLNWDIGSQCLLIQRNRHGGMRCSWKRASENAFWLRNVSFSLHTNCNRNLKKSCRSFIWSVIYRTPVWCFPMGRSSLEPRGWLPSQPYSREKGIGLGTRLCCDSLENWPVAIVAVRLGCCACAPCFYCLDSETTRLLLYLYKVLVPTQTFDVDECDCNMDTRMYLRL